MAVPSHPQDAPGLLRACFSLAKNDGRVCVFVEPIARYHTRDLVADDDGRWTASYIPPGGPESIIQLDQVRLHGEGEDILLVTFGNGVYLGLRAAERLRDAGVDATVLDLRWLAPLPVQALWAEARRFDAVLVVDETRHSGGVAESVLAGLVEGGHRGRLARVCSADSFIPLGPAAETVLLGEAEIIDSALQLVNGRARPAPRITTTDDQPVT
jgi:2-oxoisovalerate dehydrogenase E1 component